jgi:hypothetical protein
MKKKLESQIANDSFENGRGCHQQPFRLMRMNPQQLGGNYGIGVSSSRKADCDTKFPSLPRTLNVRVL